jgi:hypothetical protein
LKSVSVRPRSLDRTFTIWPSRFNCMPLIGSIFCSWKSFVGIILINCGFLFPNAFSGVRFSVYSFSISFPVRSSSKPSGSILCPTERMNGLISSVLKPAFSAAALMFVSKTSSVSVIFPVKDISMKSFLFIVIFVDAVLGF